jgi:phosphoserine phosphatase RsbU/P
MPSYSSAAPDAPLGLSEHALLSWLRLAVDEHAILALTDGYGVIVSVNDQFCRVSGYTRQELLGQTHALLKSGQHPPEFYADMWGTLLAGRTWHGAICNRAKDGSRYWVQSTLVPLPGTAPGARPAGFLALRTDVSRLIQAERALTFRNRELQLLFEHSPIGLSYREMRADGTPGANNVNQRFCDLVGLSREEARDIANVHRVSHPDDLARQNALTQEIYAARRDGFTIEKRYLHADGRLVWGVLTVVVLRETNGRVTHHFAMLEDITARKLAEEELKRTEARWRTYLQTASEILYALTPEGCFKFVSQAWSAKLGHNHDTVLGLQYRDFVHPEDRPRWDEFFATVLHDRRQGAVLEYRILHADGRWLWHASTGSAYNDRDKRTAYFGVGRDISARRKAQDELRAALSRLEEMARIVDRSPSVVVLWRAQDGNWPVEFVSASVRQFGYEPEDLVTNRLTFRQITHPDDRERVGTEVDAHAAAHHREYTQEYRIQCADGTFRWVDDHTIVRLDEQGAVTHHEGVITDITARKLADERARAAQERELTLARDVQQHLLPTTFPPLDRLEVEVFSQSSQQLGGDYYDVLEVDDRHTGFVIADVSGKGAPAALMMAACRAALRLCASGQPDPALVLQRVNRALQPDMPPGMYITCFYGVLDRATLTLRFCRAGHEPALLLRAAGGPPELLGEGGLALGLAPADLFDTSLSVGHAALAPGDLVALYTDGINEACNASDEEFGRDRLAETLRRHQAESLAEILRRMDRYLRQFCALAPRHDDRALLLLRARR